MTPVLYSDLDDTLIFPEDLPDGSISIIVRPEAPDFLDMLSGYGQVWILSMATRPHVENAMGKLGRRAQRAVSGILTREDLKPVIEEIELIDTLPKLRDEHRRTLEAEIPPLFPSGVIFDDQPVNSIFYRIKRAALGIDAKMWVQVGDAKGGLWNAYRRFLSRFAAPKRRGKQRAAPRQ